MISVSIFSPHLAAIPRSFVRMSASATQTPGGGVSQGSMAIKPPSHPTYDLKAVVNLALAEDAGHTGDVTCLATIPFDMEVEAYFLAKEDGIVAGIALADMIFEQVDPSLKLCFLQLMADAACPARILETRKTAPGLRLVDKWAVLIGGGRNHRMGLFDMVMIKDNHISAAGGIINAIKSVDEYLKQKNLEMDVEVETRTLEEVKEVLGYVSGSKTRLTRIMLDNMVVPLDNGDIDVTMLKEAVELINGRFETEASGNVTLETVHKIGQSGVTFISSGALTHSVKALDISLKIDTELALEVGRRTKRA
ncbi:PREDICTED: nicotinate-nucleotide pyrophosphorylase [carboxylating], chloroplastic-like [Camelina sativa]|uniref:Nicotinate-nucleotide pyrophosphorylase [carboxylating] n=1 Tax=Camelina sativa TaxID=90675 RepID=A0ABM0ZP79_CAMSA|nr:PREDICTED: nicotinate-nucleotide pyrophosphorylase [carboxylating], chloroplastic-like [Camelina sativa]